MNERWLEEHLERYRNFLLKVDKWRSTQGSAGTADRLHELLAEHENLIIDVGIDALGKHLFQSIASGQADADMKPADPVNHYPASGVLAAAAEIVYAFGAAHMGASAYEIAGDLLRLSAGGGSLLAANIVPAKAPFDDMIADTKRRLILRAHCFAGRDGGIWIEKVPFAVGERTLKDWNSAVPEEDRDRARAIGKLAAAQQPLDADQQAFEDYILRYSDDELRRVLAKPPSQRKRGDA